MQSGYLLGLLKFIFQGLLSCLELQDFVGEAVLHVISAELHVGSVRSVLEAGLSELVRVDLSTDGVTQAANVILHLSNFFLGL